MITSTTIATLTNKYHDDVKRDIVIMFPEIKLAMTYTLDRDQAEKLALTYSTHNMLKIMRAVCDNASKSYTEMLIAKIMLHKKLDDQMSLF